VLGGRHALISLARFKYRVPVVLAGEPVEAVVAGEQMVRMFHRDVLVAACPTTQTRTGFGQALPSLRCHLE
jgi:hypothetical protein